MLTRECSDHMPALSNGHRSSNDELYHAPCAAAEDAVVTEVRRILHTTAVVTQVSAALKRDGGGPSETDAITALQEFPALRSQLFPAEQARIIQLLVRRVTVPTAGLDVDVRREGIAGVIREMVAPRRLEPAE